MAVRFKNDVPAILFFAAIGGIGIIVWEIVRAVF